MARVAPVTQDIVITITVPTTPDDHQAAQAGSVTEVADCATGENTTANTAGAARSGFADVDTIDTYTATVVSNGESPGRADAGRG